MLPLLLALVTLASALSVGPAEPPPVGIAQTTTRDVLSAADGTTWFATDVGVILRDPGSRWRMLPDGVPGTPRRLFSAPDGGVWVSADRGVVGYGPDGTLRPGPDAPNQAAFPPPLQVMPDGTVWASFSGNDLYFRDASGTWSHNATKTDVRSFALGPDGTLHGAGGKGRLSLSKGADRWVTTTDTTKVHLDSLAVGADGGVWERDLKGGLQWFGPEERQPLGRGHVHAVLDTPDGVWLLGTGRVWSVHGEELEEHPLPVEVGWDKVLALTVSASHHIFVVTERGLFTLTSTPFGRRAVCVRRWPFTLQHAAIATVAGRPDAVWVASAAGAVMIDAGGQLIEDHRRRFEASVGGAMRIVTAPDGRPWAVGPNVVGPVDLPRGVAAALWRSGGPISFAADGAPWFALDQTLMRLDPATGEATHVPLRQPAKVVDARPDRVRVLGVSTFYPATMDWIPSTQRWSPVRGMDAPVREALQGALGPPLRTSDGTAWWPTRSGLVREGRDGGWTVVPLPEAGGEVTDVVRVGDTILVGARHGLWRLGKGDTIERVGAFGEADGVSLAVCDTTLWVGADSTLIELREGVPVATHPIDARPLGCVDGALWVSSPGVARLGPHGSLEQLRPTTSPPFSTGGRMLLTPPTRGGWAVADQGWIVAPGTVRALDLRTGAQTALGPWGNSGGGTFDQDGSMWRSTGSRMERWDPISGRIERQDLGPKFRPTAVNWERLLADGALEVAPFNGPYLRRARGTTMFVESPEPEGERGQLFLEGTTRWSAWWTGLWRQDGATWTRVVEGAARFVSAAGSGKWVGLEGSVPLVRVVGGEVVERLHGVVPGDVALGVLEDRQGRLWVAGKSGVVMRDTSGAWTRDGSPWQNGRGAGCPFPVERSVPRGWEDAKGEVPRGVVTEGTLTASGLQYFQVEKKMFRTPGAEWPALRDQWLRTAPYDPEGPWTAAIQWMWEEADGGLRFVAERTEGAREGPAIYALVDGRWRRHPGSPEHAQAYTYTAPRVGGGRWLLSQDGDAVEVGLDGTPLRRLVGEPRAVALAAEGGQVVVGAQSVAAAHVGGAWVGRPERQEVPIAIDGGLLLTEHGSLLTLHGEDAWTAPMDWVADVVTLEGRPCVVGGGVRCLNRETGAWTSYGDGALVDAAARGRTLWVAGLMGPDGTSGGVVCRGPETWACFDVPGIARAVLPDAVGGAWVGTTQGLVYVDAAGRVKKTALTEPVTRLAEGATTLWVGTERDGVWTWDRASQRSARIVAGAVYALAADGPAAWAWTEEGIRALRE